MYGGTGYEGLKYRVSHLSHQAGYGTFLVRISVLLTTTWKSTLAFFFYNKHNVTLPLLLEIHLRHHFLMKVSAERRSTAEKIIDDRFPVSLSTPDSNAPPVKLHAKEICSGLTCTPHFFTEWFVYEMILISSTFLNDRNHRRNVQTKDKRLTHGLFWTSRCVFNPSRQVMHAFYIKLLTGIRKHGVMQKVCPPQ